MHAPAEVLEGTAARELLEQAKQKLARDVVFDWEVFAAVYKTDYLCELSQFFDTGKLKFPVVAYCRQLLAAPTAHSME